MVDQVSVNRYRADFHEAPALLGKLKRMGGGGRKRSSAYVDPRDIEGCEALLEAHFTQVQHCKLPAWLLMCFCAF